MKLHFKLVTLFIIFQCTNFIIAALPLKKTVFDEKLTIAEQLIEEGSINIAYLLLKDYSNSKKISETIRYRVYRDIAKIHLYEQDLVNFEKMSKKAYLLKKNKGEIYKGMYYAEKAYFWHYLTWGDSAAYYSNQSMDIIQRNRKDFDKINVAFVYQMYAIGFLYRKLDSNIKVKIKHQMPVARVLMNQWFDSAKVYEKKFPFQFSSDRVLLYRGVGTRFLDHVSGYQYGFKEYQKTMNYSQWYSYKKAMEAYNYTLNNVINPKNWNDIIFTKSLKGLCYMCIGEKIKAKNLFNSVINMYAKQYNNYYKNPNSRALMTLYSYKTINDESLPFNEIQTKKDIEILKNLNKSWWASFVQSKEFNYDTYSESPNNYLFKLYLRRYLIKKNKKDLEEATSHLLSQILNFHFIKQEKSSNDNRNNNANLELSKISDSKLKNKIKELIKLRSTELKLAPKVSLPIIQMNLKHNECLIIPCFRKSSKDSYKIIIQKNDVSIVSAKNDLNYSLIDYDTLTFEKYKDFAFNEYEQKIKPVLSKNWKFKKIYTMYFDFSNYSQMISDRIGNNFEQLNYLVKNIQFVSIYDPYEFFTGKQQNSEDYLNFIRLENKDFSSLPFMNQLASSKFNTLRTFNNIFQGDLSYYLRLNGIIHFYGHGNLKINSELGSVNIELPYQTNAKDSSISSITEQKVVNNALIVFNNCFSGYNSNVSSREFDRGIYLNLLNKGARNIIISPTKTDDESSSKIFLHFYQNIEKGESTSDALYHSQLTYLKSNKGITAHPKFWAPYRLISNYRYPIYEVSSNENQKLKYLFWSVGSIIFSLIIVLYVRKQRF